MTEKPYNEMTDQELLDQMAIWGANVDSASGFPSAYFAAKQCKAIKSHCDKRGVEIENKWPITFESEVH